MTTSSTLGRILAVSRVLLPELFRVALVTFLALIFLEEFSPGFVSRSLQPTTLFLVTVLIGVVSLPFLSSSPFSRTSNETRARRKPFVLPLVLALICAIIVYAKLLPADGVVAAVAGLAAGILVFLLGVVLPRLSDEES